jgi:NADPH2:quinone reductase
MRALLCKEFGSADLLRIEAVPDPEPSHNEVVVEIHAAGLNFPDTLAIAGQYQVRTQLPFIPGGEAAGKVVALGDGVKDRKIGDRVLVSGATGAFAEKICKPADELVTLPDTMDYATGAGFLAAYGTSYYALRQRANLQSGESLLVLGAAGGVGLAAVDIGSAFGANVIAAASSDDKLDLACRFGAKERINYVDESLKQTVKALTKGTGADVVYDPVGGQLSEQALRATNWNGRFLVIGFAAGEIAKIPLNLCLLKGCSIVGVFYGAWAQRDPAAYKQNISELFSLHAEGEINPLVSRVFPLEDYVEAMSILTGRKALGKIVFRIKDETSA